MKHTLSYRFGHPNPQFFRENYKVLNGEWDFVFDFLDEGIDKEYNKNFPTDCLKINVPFPYQAKSSLIGQDKTHCDAVWYRKKIILDNSRIHSICDFEMVSIEEGIKRYYDYIKQGTKRES